MRVFKFARFARPPELAKRSRFVLFGFLFTVAGNYATLVYGPVSTPQCRWLYSRGSVVPRVFWTMVSLLGLGFPILQASTVRTAVRPPLSTFLHVKLFSSSKKKI